MFGKMTAGDGDALWNAIRARVEVVADMLGLADHEVEDAMSDEGLIEFAMRHRQSLDWIVRGDVRHYLRAGL